MFSNLKFVHIPMNALSEVDTDRGIYLYKKKKLKKIFLINFISVISSRTTLNTKALEPLLYRSF